MKRPSAGATGGREVRANYLAMIAAVFVILSLAWSVITRDIGTGTLFFFFHKERKRISCSSFYWSHDIAPGSPYETKFGPLPEHKSVSSTLCIVSRSEQVMNPSGSVRWVSPQTLLSNLGPLRSVLCVTIKNGRIGSAISDQYLGSASPLWNTTNHDDILQWIRERKVGGVVFASESNSSMNQLQERLVSQQIWYQEQERNWHQESVEEDMVLGCHLNQALDEEEALQAAIEEARTWDVDPSEPSTGATVALKRFLRQRNTC